ncbi:MAG: tetratricopeptide repeat protein [Anaerolineae bacterium]|nr:tetratricopeptide repeat protein [Anaerolineae bacterium]
MYLKTPKRYTPKGRKRRLISLRWWWLYLLTLVVVVVGAGIWNQREMLRVPIEQALLEQLEAIEDRAATAQAPTPTATDSPINYLNAGAAAYQRGALDEAIDNYLLAAEGMPNDVAIHYELAHMLITNGRAEEGVRAAEKAINADPYSPEAWAIQGMAYEWLGEFELALPRLYRALELDPQNATAYSFLAETYMDMGNAEEALEAAETALELDPTNFNVQRNYGYVSEFTAQYDQAMQAYERAFQLEPSRAYIAFNLVDLYRRQNQYDRAVSLLRDVIDRNPESAAAYARLANILLADLGEREQARDAAERCTAIAPNNVACLAFLGTLQLTDGEYNLCARSLDRAIEAGSTNALHYYYAGTCHIVIDDCVRAREILLRGMELAQTVETQEDIRDALAQCQVIVTLVPTPTPEGSTGLLDGESILTPEAETVE